MTTYRIRLAKRASTIVVGAGMCALLGIGSAEAYSGFGTAVVEDRNGKPCFGLPTRAFESLRSPRLLQALTVHRHGTENTWSFMYHPSPAALLKPGQCIVYGEIPASATLLDVPQPLIPGALYGVFLNVRRIGPIAGYTATFCLKAQPDGSTRVIPVHHDEHKGWTAEACRS
ncbi:hypothetical protein [Stenotrophomonas sp. ZAC14A_NAIMI4_1]|uniref:hypothetical protein n=1 Tax=Stenotrophomonas sp. ZAC14A_NAIMI4_1 TaxID=2072412 RepID=UPI000D53ECA0|nr:hypothetical protein [Stenotrophomonas sp. ZAC14A_NAIMI4_1]AWH46809.1 hypothetical protein C1926_18180 [Stenotrophomonas sp. ZAC14A_NAIMI4_1]